jgi:hypothetical protein
VINAGVSGGDFIIKTPALPSPLAAPVQSLFRNLIIEQIWRTILYIIGFFIHYNLEHFLTHRMQKFRKIQLKYRNIKFLEFVHFPNTLLQAQPRRLEWNNKMSRRKYPKKTEASQNKKKINKNDRKPFADGCFLNLFVESKNKIIKFRQPQFHILCIRQSSK